jgi:hypothetical protein
LIDSTGSPITVRDDPTHESKSKQQKDSNDLSDEAEKLQSDDLPALSNTKGNNLSGTAETLLKFFISHYVETKMAGFNKPDDYELGKKSGIDSLAVSDAIDELTFAGILGFYRRTNYIYLRKQYLQKQGLYSSNTNEQMGGRASLAGERAAARCTGPTHQSDTSPTSWIPGVEFNPPVRIHRLVFYGKLDPVATEYLRFYCDKKGKDDQWWTRSFPLGSVRVSKYGSIQLYPKDYDSAAPFCEEFSRFLQNGNQKGDLTCEGEFAYQGTGDRLHKVKKGRCKLILKNYTVEIFFDKSLGQEAEHRIKAELSGDIEAARDLSLSLAVPAFLYEKIEAIDTRLDRIEKQTAKRPRKQGKKYSTTLRDEIIQIKELLFSQGNPRFQASQLASGVAKSNAN